MEPATPLFVKGFIAMQPRLSRYRAWRRANNLITYLSLAIGLVTVLLVGLGA